MEQAETIISVGICKAAVQSSATLHGRLPGHSDLHQHALRRLSVLSRPAGTPEPPSDREVRSDGGGNDANTDDADSGNLSSDWVSDTTHAVLNPAISTLTKEEWEMAQVPSLHDTALGDRDSELTLPFRIDSVAELI